MQYLPVVVGKSRSAAGSVDSQKQWAGNCATIARIDARTRSEAAVAPDALSTAAAKRRVSRGI